MCRTKIKSKKKEMPELQKGKVQNSQDAHHLSPVPQCARWTRLSET